MGLMDRDYMKERHTEEEPIRRAPPRLAPKREPPDIPGWLWFLIALGLLIVLGAVIGPFPLH